MLKRYNNKRIVISLLFLLLLFFCNKKESKKDNLLINSVKYAAGNEGVKLSKERQKEAYGKWKLTNVVFFDNSKRTSKKIEINENVNVKEQGVFNSKNNAIANKHNTIGTYQFKNLDTLNTIYYIFSIEKNRMMMKSPILFRVVNGKMTKQRARAEVFFIKENH